VTSAILQTKLNIPQTRLSIIQRPRLMDKLNAGMDSSLILVSAPAGYGKTTLIAEWLPVTQHRRTWFSLDESDNSPRQFLIYLLTALQQVQKEIGQSVERTLQASELPALEAMIKSLLSEWSADMVDTLLVLDDYHVITNMVIHEALNTILTYLPPRLHLVILTRADPPLPLARLRVRNHLTELRASDLRFSVDETAAFLSQTMGLTLSQEQAASLEVRTEGWVAGLQLAGLSMQGREDVEEFITAFTGSHHYIVDYLVEDVLNRQSELVKEFLLKTSILEQMSASLCNALTKDANSQSMLEELERTNLFVVSLDNERNWYRYHHLFADVLRKHLKTQLPQIVQELHHRASDWYQLNGQSAEAFSHAMLGEDSTRALDIVEENAWKMVLHGELAILQDWVRSLPAEMISKRPWLCIHYAWALLFSGEADSAEKQLQSAEACFGKNQATDMPIEIQGHSLAIRAWISYQGGNLEQAVAMSRQAIEFIPEMDPAVRCLLAGILGQGCVAENDFVEAARHYTDMVRMAYASGNVMMEVAAQCALGWLKETMGKLQDAETIYQAAIERAVQFNSPSVGQAYLNLANVYYERNELDLAKQNGQKAIESARTWGHVDALATGYLYMARITHAQNDEVNANANLSEMENTIRGHVLEPPTLILLEALSARLSLIQGNHGAAHQWVKEQDLTIDDPINFFNEVQYLTWAQLLLAENQLDSVVPLLERLHKEIESSARFGNLIEVLVLLSLAFEQQGKPDTARATLLRALDLGESEGYMRVFLNLGSPMEHSLKQLKVENPNQKIYIQNLLVAFGGSIAPESNSKSQLLIVPLSERELEVLRLVALGKSNRQIADDLVLATGTVKRHLNNIFGKLNVQNRTECVARVKELDLL